MESKERKGKEKKRETNAVTYRSANDGRGDDWIGERISVPQLTRSLRESHLSERTTGDVIADNLIPRNCYISHFSRRAFLGWRKWERSMRERERGRSGENPGRDARRFRGAITRARIIIYSPADNSKFARRRLRLRNLSATSPI